MEWARRIYTYLILMRGFGIYSEHREAIYEARARDKASR